MKKCGFGVLISILFTILVVASAHAGALWLYEEATPDMGVAGAGTEGDEAAAAEPPYGVKSDGGS